MDRSGPPPPPTTRQRSGSPSAATWPGQTSPASGGGLPDRGHDPRPAARCLRRARRHDLRRQRLRPVGALRQRPAARRLRAPRSTRELLGALALQPRRAGSQRLLASASYVGVWDDHEVVNDFGPLHDTRDTPPYTPGVHILPIGLDAFLDYTPIAAPGTRRSACTARCGGGSTSSCSCSTRGSTETPTAPRTASAEDDARPRAAHVAEQAASPPRTPRGRSRLERADVDPDRLPAANGRDGWANFDQATGFEQELSRILRGASEPGTTGSVWITTDVHFAEAFRYRPFGDRPASRARARNRAAQRRDLPERRLHPTLNPEVLGFFGPATPEAVTSWEEAKEWFNFGTLEGSTPPGALTAAIVNTAGERGVRARARAIGSNARAGSATRSPLTSP